MKNDSLKIHQNEDGSFSMEWDKKDPNCGMRFVSAYGPVNAGRFGHSQSWKYKKEKKRSYYW